MQDAKMHDVIWRIHVNVPFFEKAHFLFFAEILSEKKTYPGRKKKMTKPVGLGISLNIWKKKISYDFIV